MPPLTSAGGCSDEQPKRLLWPAGILKIRFEANANWGAPTGLSCGIEGGRLGIGTRRRWRRRSRRTTNEPSSSSGISIGIVKDNSFVPCQINRFPQRRRSNSFWMWAGGAATEKWANECVISSIYLCVLGTKNNLAHVISAPTKQEGGTRKDEFSWQEYICTQAHVNTQRQHTHNIIGICTTTKKEPF